MSTRTEPTSRVEYTPRPFRPAWWLPGAHAQTIVGRFLRPAVELSFRRERLETPDGDFLDLDFVETELPADAPVVVVLHGLEGRARSRYMLTTYRALLGRGIRPVGMNFRSCSGELNRTARFYHSGETGDLRLVAEHLARRYPDARRGAVGFSLGGNMLLKFLGAEAETAASLLDAAAAISVPFDLTAGADRIGRGLMGRFYTEYFLVRLRKKIRAKRALLDGACDPDRAVRARTLREFDDAATAPLHGFDDAADYYRRASSAPEIGGIRVPTLILHSRDDPFLPPAAIPRDAAADNPQVTAVFTERGGHQGFVTGPAPWAASFWAEEEVGRFLAAALERPAA